MLTIGSCISVVIRDGNVKDGVVLMFVIREIDMYHGGQCER